MPVFPLALTLLMAVSLVYDVRYFIIPNWISVALLALYPLLLLLSPVHIDWKMALLAFALVFAAGYVMFMLKWMGGGDVKLMACCALWTGFAALPPFIVGMALVGGAFSLGLLLARKPMPWVFPAQHARGTLPRILTQGAPVPYGVAIATGFLMVLWSGQLAGVSF